MCWNTPQSCFVLICSQMDVSLVLLNANVLTMQRDRPRAEAVAIAGDRILSVGNNADIRRLSSTHTRIVDCHGLTLLPGFNDAHCHLPGLARRLQDLDCSPQRAMSIPALLKRWCGNGRRRGRRDAGCAATGTTTCEWPRDAIPTAGTWTLLRQKIRYGWNIAAAMLPP